MKKGLFLILSLFFATIVHAQLSGTYTINSNASQNPSYTSFGAAVTALTAQGVAGPVLFEVAPGTYNEYVNLTEVSGTSETNRITFKGMGADNQQVVVTSNAGYTDNNTLKLDGTDYITFENMTLTSTSTGKAVLLRFNGQVDHSRFENVRFVGVEVPSSSSDNDKNLVHMNNGEGWINHNTEFVGCQFINGCIALYLQGKNMYQFNEGVLVENCYFDNQQFKSIYLTFYNDVVVRGNTIVNANDWKTDYNAIDIFQCYNGAIFEQNVMNVTRTTSYSTVFRIRPCVGTETNHVIIRNNIVNLQANSDSYAFAIDYNDCNYIDFANNTLKCTGTGENINVFVQKNGTNFNFYNNLLVNETNGYVFRFNNDVTGRVSDYNRISFTGDYIGRFTSTNCATLSDWTTATGFDANSALCTPQFVGDNDLHITSSIGLAVAHPLAYVPKDIDEQDRSATTPCAGADEYLEGVNLPPVVANPIANVVFETYPASQTISLSNTFTDPDDPDEDIVIELASNSNPTLVSASLENHMLTVQRLLATGGGSTITLLATSNSQAVETSFYVECIAEDLPPVVATPLAPIHFTEFPQSLNFDLTNTFDDPDNNNSMIEISVLSCPSEITATYNNFVLTVIRNTPSAFSDKVMVIRATSNGKVVDMEVLVSGDAVVVGPGTATFEDVTLYADGVWQAPQEGNNTFISSGWIFTNYYSDYFWGGFTVSNHTDLSQVSLNAQYTAAAGVGYDESAQYAVAYTMGAQTEVSTADGSMQTVSGCYVTNNLWAYQNMLDGDYSATPFGGATGNDPDWFKLTATGKNSSGQTVGTVNFYLADYRFTNPENDYILNTWEWFDLSLLGPVSSISFSLSSSKNNAYGMITPAYFCMDDFNGTGPETPDQPPYIANPVADVVFNLFPQSIDVDLNGVASDPDNDDNSIAYSLISNSNEAALSATLIGKTLTLNRLINGQATADLTLRAFSNGLYVDFIVHVDLMYYEALNEDNLSISVFPNPSHGPLNLSLGNHSGFEYQVHDLLGQQVLSGYSQGETTCIDLSSCRRGVYFVSLRQNGTSHVEKVVIH